MKKQKPKNTKEKPTAASLQVDKDFHKEMVRVLKFKPEKKK